MNTSIARIALRLGTLPLAVGAANYRIVADIRAGVLC